MGSDELITPEQLAEYLSVSVATLANWRIERPLKIEFVKIGSLVRYRRSEVESFIERHSVTGVGETPSA